MRYFIFVFLCAHFFSLSAQKTLSVVDENASPLEFVRILHEDELVAFTKPDGTVFIDSAWQKLQFQLYGHQTTQRNYKDIKNGDTLVLESIPIELNEVIIYSKKANRGNKNILLGGSDSIIKLTSSSEGSSIATEFIPSRDVQVVSIHYPIYRNNKSDEVYFFKPILIDNSDPRHGTSLLSEDWVFPIHPNTDHVITLICPTSIAFSKGQSYLIGFELYSLEGSAQLAIPGEHGKKKFSSYLKSTPTASWQYFNSVMNIELEVSNARK